MGTIDEVRGALVSLVGDEAKARMLAARVILRTGVNLMAPRPDHARSPDAIRKVVEALAEMGFHFPPPPRAEMRSRL